MSRSYLFCVSMGSIAASATKTQAIPAAILAQVSAFAVTAASNAAFTSPISLSVSLTASGTSIADYQFDATAPQAPLLRYPTGDTVSVTNNSGVSVNCHLFLTVSYEDPPVAP